MTHEVADKCAPPKKAFCFVFEDEPFKSEKRVVTPAEIRSIVGIEDEVPIVQILPCGTQVQLAEGEAVELEKCHKLKKLPRFVRGFDRVEAELELIRREHPRAELTKRGVLLHDFAFPDAFVKNRERVLIPVSPAYPTAPPDNFLVPWGVALRSGQALQAYTGPVALEGEPWGQFSHHIEKGAWRPSQDPAEGDNILTYILTVHGRLKQGA